MQYHQINSKYYCGIDLHSKSIFVCIMDKEGKIYYHRNMRNDFDNFKETIQPFLPDIAVGCEASGYFYWLADGCRENNIPFYLGHALYMRAISDEKKKNDFINSKTISDLMRANLLPYAFTYPSEWRSTRDLLRRRRRMVRIRAEAYTHIQSTFKQHGIMDALHKIVKNKKERRSLVDRFDDADLQMTIASPVIQQIELKIFKGVKYHDRKSYNMLLGVPGVGQIIALTLLYEIYDINRFSSVQRFSSYSGLVKCERESAGKNTGGAKRKIRNAHLKHAFSEIIIKAPVSSQKIRKYYEKLQAKHGKKKAKSIITHKFGVAIYFMLKNGEAFDEDRFVNNK
jgi:transposase